MIGKRNNNNRHATAKMLIKKGLLNIPGFEMLCRFLTQRHVRALMYHRFSANSANSTVDINQDTLRAQLTYLKRYHVFWKAQDHFAAIRNQGMARNCPVVVTVDDGYNDFFEQAFPIFSNFDVPVTFFVTTEFLNGKVWLWWDKLRFMLKRMEPTVITINVAGRRMKIDLRTPQGVESAWNDIADLCCFLPENVKNSFLTNLESDYDLKVPLKPTSEYRAVTWEELGQMILHGVQVGAHTCNHPILTRLPIADANREIEYSKATIWTKTQTMVNAFCYPQGGPHDINHQISRLVEKAGFDGAYISYQDLQQKSDPFWTSRYSVNSDMVDFRWSMSGAERLSMLAKGLFRFNRNNVSEDYCPEMAQQ